MLRFDLFFHKPRSNIRIGAVPPGGVQRCGGVEVWLKPLHSPPLAPLRGRDALGDGKVIRTSRYLAPRLCTFNFTETMNSAVNADAGRADPERQPEWVYNGYADQIRAELGIPRRVEPARKLVSRRIAACSRPRAHRGRASARRSGGRAGRRSSRSGARAGPSGDGDGEPGPGDGNQHVGPELG